VSRSSRRENAERVREANGVPLWLAYLEPVLAYVGLIVAVGVFGFFVVVIVWTVWLIVA
jgi:hypothetical protein